MDSRIVVSIRCTTYNHGPYIGQCLDSLLSQVTSFRYEIIVHDDASTDNTAEIIREYAEKYPEIIVPVIEEQNVFSRDPNLVRKIVTSYCRGQYMAWCEGDDYWLDPHKLQKQVDILEQNNDIGLVYGKSRQFDQEKGSFLKTTLGEAFHSPAELLLHNSIPTATVMVRASTYHDYMRDEEIQANKWLMGDYPLWIYFSVVSKVCFLDEELAVYRVLRESASHSVADRKKMESFFESAIEMKRFFNQRYQLVDELILDSQYSELMLYNAAVFGDRVGVIENYAKIVEPSRVPRILLFLARFRLLFFYRFYKLHLRSFGAK